MTYKQPKMLPENVGFRHYIKTAMLVGVLVLMVTGCKNNTSKSFQEQHLSLEQDSIAAVKLGRYLFYDNHLSFNQTKSCSSCHDPALAFTDGYKTSSTANGDNVLRNSPSLINVVFQKRLDWANPFVTNSFQQNERPLFNEHPIELGLKNNEEEMLSYFLNNNNYRALFAEAYTDDSVVTVMNIRKSLAAFVNSLVSSASAYDAFIKGDSSRLSPSAKNGLRLFFSSELQCSSCHAPPLFTINDRRNTISPDSIYFNTHLNKEAGADKGLFLVTHNLKDIGKFKVPSLRNVALTSPYLHDGSIATLGEIIDLYSHGGGIEVKLKDGKGKTGNKDSQIKGFSISLNEKRDLIAFLHCLTDSTIANNPLFSNPNTY